MKWLLDWISENRGLFIGLVAGLAVAILFLTIGFWATLLIMVCTGAGAYLGSHPDVVAKIPEMLRALFTKPGGQ